MPVLSQHLQIAAQSDGGLLTNTQHQVPLTVTLPAGRPLKLLARVNGLRSLSELGRLVSAELGTDQGAEFDQPLFWNLYRADLVNLRRNA